MKLLDSTNKTLTRQIDMKLYTAGKMPKQSNSRNLIGEWREELDKEFGSSLFLHPTFSGCDHTGINLQDTVDTDIQMIKKSSGVIGFLETNDQFGTIYELCLAASMHRNVYIFVSDALSKSEWGGSHDGFEQSRDTFYDAIGTTHSCGCSLTASLSYDIDPKAILNEYWFALIGLAKFPNVKVFPSPAEYPGFINAVKENVFVTELKMK